MLGVRGVRSVLSRVEEPPNRTATLFALTLMRRSVVADLFRRCFSLARHLPQRGVSHFALHSALGHSKTCRPGEVVERYGGRYSGAMPENMGELSASKNSKRRIRSRWTLVNAPQSSGR